MGVKKVRKKGYEVRKSGRGKDRSNRKERNIVREMQTAQSGSEW